MRVVVAFVLVTFVSVAHAEPPRLVPAQRASAAQHKKAAKEHANNRDDLLATAEWRAAAELGDPEAQFTLARRLERGLGVMDYPDLIAKAKLEAEQLDALALAQGYGPAVERIKKAAEQGDPKAQAKFAQALAAQGHYEAAIDYYRSAAEAGTLDADGLKAMGDLLASGTVLPEVGETQNIYARALTLGNLDAEVALAALFFDGKGGVARDAAWGRKTLATGAARGRVPATLELARRFEHGDGLDPNHAAALRVVGKCPARECVLVRARLLFAGEVRRDPRTAVSILREHARAGWFPAVDLLLTIANQGEQGAQLLVADMYLRGEGLEQDSYEAFRWYSDAAAQGNPGALNALGDLYAKGEGCVADPVKARESYERASAAGSLEARQKLSLMR